MIAKRLRAMESISVINSVGAMASWGSLVRVRFRSDQHVNGFTYMHSAFFILRMDMRRWMMLAELKDRWSSRVAIKGKQCIRVQNYKLSAFVGGKLHVRCLLARTCSLSPYSVYRGGNVILQRNVTYRSREQHTCINIRYRNRQLTFCP